ncbi:MAG: hypothetical protein HYX60_04430, partial [Legionella longbeachae]|nr:hypothetical protein [Legionella longbeachae]
MSYTKLDGCIALAMLEQALNDHNIKEILTTIAHQLHQDVLSELINQEKLGLTPKLSSLAMQHCSGDKFVGALLPQYEYEFLDKDPNGRQLLLTTIDSCLKESKINTSHEFLSLMKSIDGMAFIYDMFETNKKNINHLQCKTYISPTSDEIGIRDLRQEKLAITYGIETKTDIDLIEKKKLASGCVSGKARFFILPTENRDQIWFEKLANQSTLNKASLPLIAGPSNATAKNFIMIHGLALFKNENGLFDLDNAQKFANCFM